LQQTQAQGVIWPPLLLDPYAIALASHPSDNLSFY